MSDAVGYSAAQKFLHWTIAGLILVQLPLGVTLGRLGEGMLTNVLYELHKSFGLTVFGLALVRIFVRSGRGAPPLEPMPEWQRRAAYASHYALYALIVLVPLAGWTATSMGFPPVLYFWTVPVTLPLSGGEAIVKAIYGVHGLLALTLAGIAAVHIAAALHHHFVRRDATLRRMLPGSGEREATRRP